MTQPLSELKKIIQKIIQEGHAAIVCGTGVSLSVVGTGVQAASWPGLIEETIKFVNRHQVEVADDNIQILKQAVKTCCTEDFLNAYKIIAKILGGKKHSQFQDWLNSTLGMLEKCNPTQYGLDLISKIEALHLPILTTNLDGIIEEHTGRNAVVWSDEEALLFIQAKANDEVDDKVFHLHGHYAHPLSVVLSDSDYDEHLETKRIQIVQRGIFLTRSWIFIGCGQDGITDPDFGYLIKEFAAHLHDSQYPHFILCRDSDVSDFEKVIPKEIQMHPVSYGKEYGDLVPFLSELVPYWAFDEGLPNLPGEYSLPRDEYTNSIINSLKESKSVVLHNTKAEDQPKPGLSEGALLHGMGGIGKTVIATLVAHELKRNSNYKRIFWINVGRTASEIGLLKEVISRFSGTRQLGDFSIAEGHARFSEALTLLFDQLDTDQDKVLLILDDIWSEQTLSAIMEAGHDKEVRQRLTILITCRDNSVVRNYSGFIRTPINVLCGNDAFEMLIGYANLSKKNLGAEEREDLENIATLCSGLPLALAVTGRSIASGISEKRVLKSLREKKLNLLENPNFGDQSQHKTIDKALSISIEYLAESEFGDAARSAYYDLVIFRNGAQIPLWVIRQLFKDTFKESASIDDLVSLWQKRSIAYYQKECVSLHDLFFDLLQGKIDDKASRHDRFLSVYEPESGKWHQIEDPYFIRNAAHHFIGAGRIEEYMALQFDLDWLTTKLLETGSQGILDDLETLISKCVTAHEKTSFGDELRVLSDIIRLCDPALRGDTDKSNTKSQLGIQLIARLYGKFGPRITKLRDAAHIRLTGGKQVFLPISKTLLGPMGRLKHVIGRSAAIRVVRTGFRPFRHHETEVAIIGTAKGHVELIEISNGTTTNVLKIPDGEQVSPVSDIAVMRRQWRILVATENGLLSLWDLRTTSRIVNRQLPDRDQGIIRVTGRSNADLLFSAAASGDVRIWNHQLKPCDKLKHGTPISGLALSIDESVLAVVDTDGNVAFYDAETFKLIKAINFADVGVAAKFSCIVATPKEKGRSFAISDQGGGLTILTPDTHYPSMVFTDHHDGWISQAAVSADGDHFATGGEDHRLLIWSVFDPMKPYLVGEHGYWIRGVAFNENHSILVSGSEDKLVKFWNIDKSENQPAKQPGDRHSSWIRDIATSLDGSIVVTASRDKKLKIWDYDYRDDGFPMSRSTLSGHDCSVESVAVNPKGSIIVSGDENGCIRLWQKPSYSDSKLGQVIGKANVISFSPDGKMVAAGDNSGTLWLWTIHDRRLQCQKQLHKGAAIRALAFDPDCSSLWTAAKSPDPKKASFLSTEGLVQWSLPDLKRIRNPAINPHTDFIRSIDIDAGRNRMITASEDGSMQLWCYSTLSQIGFPSREIHQRRIRGARFLKSDQNLIVSFSSDHYVKILRTPDLRVLASFCGDSPITGLGEVGPGKFICGEVFGTVHLLEYKF
jgi:WD40 repeat protein